MKNSLEESLKQFVESRLGTSVGIPKDIHIYDIPRERSEEIQFGRTGTGSGCPNISFLHVMCGLWYDIYLNLNEKLFFLTCQMMTLYAALEMATTCPTGTDFEIFRDDLIQ